MATPTASPSARLKNIPVILLIAFNLIAGLLTFRDYGFSLDEPLFYGYADAIGYAYNPLEWIRPDFDLERAFGPSPWDHRNRGPAYLILARGPAHLLQALGLDQASAWHLINFLAFQVGLYFFYLLAGRWMKPWAAFFATALFSLQPVLWEHAFINPKDPPFMVFFLISLELGFRMVDALVSAPSDEKPRKLLGHIILPAVLLGLTTSIRVLGPLAGILVGLYFLLHKKPSRLGWFAGYALIAMLIMLASWPYLWEAPLRNFLGTLTFMADNPTELRLLFYGKIYRADDLPTRYLPAMLLFTLTEPVWPLAFLGGMVALIRTFHRKLEWRTLLPTFLWLAVPILYVLVSRPPMYDGFRHFMFIIPPLFILAGIAMQAFFDWIHSAWIRVPVMALLLFSGVVTGLQLHPFEYTYYNQFVGGTGRAAARFETDYWLTCYKQAMEEANPLAIFNPILFVRREGYIASYYAAPGITVIDGSTIQATPQVGDYILMGSRADPSIQKYSGNRNMIVIERQGAVFCIIFRKTQ